MLPWPYILVDKGYREFVARCCRSGLQRLARPSRIWKHRGRRLINGAFAVGKNLQEDRFISGVCPTNALLDEVLVPRPVFAYVPRLRGLQTRPGSRVVVSKRDARHYFHALRLGRKWEKFVGHPPVTGADGASLVPVHRSAPMGFMPSAVWAQAVTDTMALAAELPPDKRVSYNLAVPNELPVWGSIVDDLWGVAELEPEERSHPTLDEWMRRVDHEWPRLDVPINEKKSGACGSEEVQACVLHPRDHRLGAGWKRRRELMAATFELLSMRMPSVHSVERLVGKLSYVHAFAPSCRSIFAEVYKWLERYREKKARRAPWCPEAWGELMASAWLAPTMCSWLGSAWRRRIECSDAAPGGHGLAWADFPPEAVAALARVAETSLRLPCGVLLGGDGRCALDRVVLPASVGWRTAPRRARTHNAGGGRGDSVVARKSAAPRGRGENSGAAGRRQCTVCMCHEQRQEQ